MAVRGHSLAARCLMLFKHHSWLGHQSLPREDTDLPGTWNLKSVLKAVYISQFFLALLLRHSHISFGLGWQNIAESPVSQSQEMPLNHRAPNPAAAAHCVLFHGKQS